MDFSFRTDYSIIFIIAAIILSILISYFYYKNSKLDASQKKLFTVLRFLSVFFIILLLSAPVISFIKSLSEKPINIFLIDISQSLLIDNRNERMKEVLREKVASLNGKNSENFYYIFSGNLYKEINEDEFESIKYEGLNNFETNLTSSFYSLQERLQNKNLSAVTVISDGIINEGGSPVLVARSMSVPVNYILVGDTIQKKDLVLRNVFYNKTAFIESNVPVKIEINSYDYEREIEVNLYEEDLQIDSKRLMVSPQQNLYDLTFNVFSNKEAAVKYKIEIAALEDEITLKNNFQEFFIKFVDNKFKVLVLSGGPGPDLAFLTQELKKIKNFDASFFTQKSPSEFYEGALPDLSIFDCYIFAGYPTAVTNPGILNDIKDKLDKNNSSLIFFASRTADYQKLSILEDRLPFKVLNQSQAEEETGIKTISSLNTEIFKNPALLSSLNNFPNIFKTASSFSVNPSAETFLLTNKNSEPAFVIQNTDNNKSAAFLAHGIYKWRLNNQNNNSNEVLNYILTGSLVAITNKEEKKPFTIETTKPVYSKFENVKFEAKITNFELEGGEYVKVKIHGGGFSNEINLTKIENRFFSREVNIPEDGNYEYTGELYSKNLLVESITNRFAVGENNFEYKLTRADNSILNALAKETKGYDFGSADVNIEDSLNFMNDKSNLQQMSFKNIELNINPYYLIIIILILSLEWFLRKRNNLP